MTYSMHFELPGLPATTNSARGKFTHWKKRYAHDVSWKKAVWAMVFKSGKPMDPLPKAKIRLVRHSSSRPDYEGLVSTFKPILDGLIEAKVISNDTFDVIGIPEYTWEKAAAKQGKIEVFVEECSPDLIAQSKNIAQNVSCHA